jgi:hypothetical protein
MPRITRDQQFTASFEQFMENICDVYYPDLCEWKLTGKTPNKTSAVHQYDFVISKKNIIYSIDSYTDANGVVHPPETLEEEQEIPMVRDFMAHFHAYFDRYILRNADSVCSYTSLANIVNNDVGDLVATIVVGYYKSYLPYPSKNHTFEQMQERCKQLEIENTLLSENARDYNTIIRRNNKDIKRLKRQVSQINAESMIRMRETVHKMQNKIRELYEAAKKEEDCPVCYECIQGQQLMVPGCCHYICEGCYDRCDACPICRENY